jgi:hypothetical protein
MVSEVEVLVNGAAALVRTLGRMKARAVVEVREKATVDGRIARRQVAMRKRTIAFSVCSVERRYPDKRVICVLNPTDLMIGRVAAIFRYLFLELSSISNRDQLLARIFNDDIALGDGLLTDECDV